MSTWEAWEGPRTVDSPPDWHFGIANARCPQCNRFLADAEPDLTASGVRAVRGVCRKHGAVETQAFDIWDVE